MFGTYRVQTAKNASLLKSAEDYIVSNQKGDTLYVNVKALPQETGPFQTQGIVSATILIPANVKLDVIGSGNSLTLNPRLLVNDWNIDSSESKDLKVTAVETLDISGMNGEWKISEKKKTAGMENEPVVKDEVYHSGEGKYHINIVNANNVSLNSGR
ncbi:hypothetical protein HPT25_09720 [Bacillus sp. BRMEA1]|nr:hypothetical protein [Neobacillus endophyticus]